jgi:hypothetical protein
MRIGDAVKALEEGRRVQRTSWNGAGQWVALMPGYPDGIAINEVTAKALSAPVGSVRTFRAYLLMEHADGTLSPWSPSPSDVMGDDWVEEAQQTP